MKYIVGTGRCGTTTLAAQLNGLHEPEPRLISEPTQYYLGDLEVAGDIKAKLKKRLSLNTDVIADNKLSTVIPLIKAVDHEAEFTLLIREPLAFIASAMARQWFDPKNPDQASEQNRLHPLFGFPKRWSQFMKCGWYWLEVNRVVLTTVGESKFTVKFTDELGDDVVLNPAKKEHRASLKKLKQKFKRRNLPRKDNAFYQERLLPFWEEIEAAWR